MSDFDIPEELKFPLEPYNKASIAYGLFTPHELVAAIIFFQSDFGDLFWAIENAKEKDYVSLLRSAKQEYDYRFYLEHERPTQLAAKYFHSKLIIFIEDCIRKRPRKIKERKIDFVEIFNLPNDKDYILKGLIEAKYIFENNYSWMQTGRNGKKLFVTLFFVLHDRGYLNVKRTSYDLFTKITNDYFNFKVSRNTFIEYKDNDDLYPEYFFIKIKNNKNIT